MTLSILLLALVPFATLAQEPQKRRGRQRPQITRQVFMRGVADYERALAEQGAMDAMLTAQYSSRLDQAIDGWMWNRGELDWARLLELTNSLRKTPEGVASTAARHLDVGLTPKVYALAGGPEKVRARVTSICPVTWKGAESLDIAVRLVSPAGTAIESATFSIAPGESQQVDAQVELAAPPKEAGCGVWSVVLAPKGGAPVEVGRWWVVPKPLEAVRKENEAKLALIRDGIAPKSADQKPRPPMASALTDAWRTAEARNADLVDEPLPAKSSQFLIDPCQHMRELDAELDALDHGRNPYQRRAGETWRPIFMGTDRSVITRVYAPESVVAAKAGGDGQSASAEAAPVQGVPLVIALHGAGFDESAFFHMYGRGRLKQLADQHGFVAVAAALPVSQFRDVHFDAIVGQMLIDYPIDPRRVYLLSHSQGAAQAAPLAIMRQPRIAAAVCIAGGDIGGGGQPPPTWVIAGELDKTATPFMLEKTSQRAREGFEGVTYEMSPNTGHYSTMPAMIDAAVAWLLERSSK